MTHRFDRLRSTHFFLTLACFSASLFMPTAVRAWGNEGHEIVGEVALHFLTPTVKARAQTLLAADTSPLTAHDFVSETTWADRFREASDADRAATASWHFTNIEVDAADIEAACFGVPAIPTGTAASAGPANDCSVDKISEFQAELASPTTSAAERLLALKFLLHFVGDLHQPLHSSDDHDRGGNDKTVTSARFGLGNLHGFWDTQLVQQLGTDPVAVGDALAARITPAHALEWSQGNPTDWATEAFIVGRDKVYAKLPAPLADGTYQLPARYITASKGIVTLQLSRAGVRLAHVLNEALSDRE